MNKLFLLFLFYCLPVLSLSAGEATEQPCDSLRRDILFERYFNWIQSGAGDSIFNHSSKHIQDQMPPILLGGIYASLQARSGDLVDDGSWSFHAKDGFWYGIRELQFTDARVRFYLTIDADEHIAGISFQPLIQNITKPDYIKERHLLVRSGRFRLQATLTMPVDCPAGGRVPVVVLVHGSGPQDLDATIGPNKPFQELAWAFAEKGIATLRYDKRTRAYGTSWADPDLPENYDTETVDDAVAALHQVTTYDGIDPRRVFLLGHSQGGMLTPRIVRRAGRDAVAGVLLMSAPARDFQTLLNEQIRYICSLPGTACSDPVVLRNSLLQNISDEYLQAVSDYRVKNDARKLRCPVLVLQGGRDYQATTEDFNLWKELLRHNKNAVFRFYPQLNHLMQSGVGEKARPEEYLQPGRMDKQVIEDMITFILK